MSPRPRLLLVGVLVLLAGACGAGEQVGPGAVGTGPSGSAAPACPAAPVDVVVTVDQWGGMVTALAGSCGRVRTIISASSGDPHAYEPTAGDAAVFARAALVVTNGLGYDAWAGKAVDALAAKPVVVDAGTVAGRAAGDDPHLWYDPAQVAAVGKAVTAALQGLAPGASGYFDDRAAEWERALTPYREALHRVQAAAAGRGYAATEPVFDALARAVGLSDRTPAGYRQAVANESEPGPADVDAFQRLLREGTVAVLVVNTQTVGALTERLRAEADAAGVPVLEVTETLPPGKASFVEWQVGQLEALERALALSR